MILICHLLIGAAIAAKIKIIPLALLFAFLSHYLLDSIPHADYSIRNIKKRRWRKSLPDFLKVFLDISLGVLLISIFSKNQPIIFVGAFLAILSDGLNFLNLILPNRLLKIHNDFHLYKIHFLKNKKISLFWRIFSQFLIILIAVYFLL